VIQHYTTNSGTAVTESAEQDLAAVIHFIMVRRIYENHQR